MTMADKHKSISKIEATDSTDVYLTRKLMLKLNEKKTEKLYVVPTLF